MVGLSISSSRETDCRPHLTQPSKASSTNPGADGTPLRSSQHSTASTDNVVANKIGTLGEFIRLDTKNFLEYGSWERLFHSVKGRSNFTPYLECLPHRAAALLHRYAKTGVPVIVQSPPWSLAQKDTAIARGDHPSVQAFKEFVLEEMQDMRQKGIFLLLPYKHLRHHPSLRISPLGCVPQLEQRPRIINDYTISGVNPSTVKMAPQEAMQWGRTFHRVLWYIFTADRRHGPVLLSKTDLVDGFYQLPLTPSRALKLAFVSAARWLAQSGRPYPFANGMDRITTCLLSGYRDDR